MTSYNHNEIEKKWHKKWEESKLYTSPNVPKNKKAYILDMFPYPSGEGLHVGHPKGYIATDIYSRFKRANGYDVLHPMGWDAFGLPAEQFALKHKIQPRVAVEKNVANFKQQLSHIGCDYDWDREINTTDPSFYKWTQWIFTKLYEKGLAYESHEPINWCPSCKTGLANEDLDGNTCERCDSVVEKKPLRQWVLKITEYADRMLNDLDTLNWPEGVKLAQKNWIGRSEGAEFDFTLIDAPQDSVRIFTTRADTLFGATFIAISAELANDWIKKGWNANEETKKYITTTLEDQNKENDYSVTPEKTGIFTGIYAVNPANQEKIPVWIANYVLGGVGTGALMAVPAHDERDFDFAKKYNLPIKSVVEPYYEARTGDSAIVDGKEFVKRDAICAIIRNPKDDKYLTISWKTAAMNGLVTGGIEEGEDMVSSALREIEEETGYSNVRLVNNPNITINSLFYHRVKQVNRWAKFHYLCFELVDETRNEVSEEEQKLHTVIWKTRKELQNYFSVIEGTFALNLIDNKNFVVTEDGVLTQSGAFTGMFGEEARTRIIEAFGGKKIVKYKIQDWVFARQRYWGEPFPVVRDGNGKVYMVDESELPVLLPNVESYEPTGTGESPLAAITDWVNVRGYITEKGTFKTKEDGEVFFRETNTMPQWAGSSWYYLRFMDPHNNEGLVGKDIEKAWGPVDVYVGGDHATRHLIYARFWHKFLYDIGIVSTIEPFSRLEFLGFILAEDGRKMSKRWGNIINPDDVVNEYGADTLRVYEMFMAPFEQTAAWSTSSIKGADKFLDRVFALRLACKETSTVQTILHKTIKKVGEDIENFKFNTAISAMMILVNEMESGSFTQEDYKKLLQILFPFAPHMTSEVWEMIGGDGYIDTAPWPLFDPSKILEKEVVVAFQVNGKMRGTFTVSRDLSDEELMNIITSDEHYKKHVKDTPVKRTIIIKNKLVNIVI